jgi:hypothetical protein
MKALEEEVLRLKESFAQTAKEREAFELENRRLKELLAAHGIQYETGSPTNTYQSHSVSSQFGSSSPGLNSRGSISTGMTSPPSRSAPGPPQQSSMGSTPSYEVQQGQQFQQQQNPSGVNYDQVGIDFVLTYDRTPYLSPPPQQ